ncbi:MAG: EutN/CcmL family microcompartment protein [Anaerolineales bacterium]|nr:EutN/CcmL family microcompartment protein [Anaerolineales bacterium]
MQLGRIVGTVVATRRDPATHAWSLRMVETLNVYNQPDGSYVVAVDVVGAGVGEVVMITRGSAARQTDLTASRPCDAVIMGIVDTWEVDDQTQYVK